MKKKLALGIGLVGAALLALSMTVFGMGAAATINLAAPDSPSTSSVESAVVPVDTTVPASTAASNVPVRTAIKSTDPAVSMATDRFKAMTPAEQANGRVWMQTQALAATCMKDKGYAYTFEPFWEIGPGEFPMSWEDTLPESDRAAAHLALYGDTGAAADYHWDEAGCWGYAVHVMGNDNNN
ncbi:hypothetical protein E3O44_09935 [Cryobacterium algoricola]|uniref:SCP domain-containing protein n=1 Tax=Cryobacterium algoricola TaxID=1259183 RepID=A0ABY2IFJ7_9MICO|nr:hypothetical protein [Cryobacterium algoricola]TFB87417.1 hypothetical protein E3O44_09935 [Cryobacterium algoricola]